MYKMAIVLSAALAAIAWGSATAAEPPAKKGADTAAPLPGVAKVELPDDAKRAAELESLLGDNKLDEAADGATKLLASTRDDAAKTTAAKVLAEALRKKSDWPRAGAAYLKLRDRYAKTSDEWYLYDATAEILRTSVKGVYTGGAAPAVTSTANDPPKTLADDAALKVALTRLADARLKALKPKVATVRAGRTPTEVAAALKPIMDEARRIRTLSDAASADVPKELVAAAGDRLKAVAAQIVPALKAKYQTIKPKADKPWSYNSAEKKDIQDTSALCTAMMEAEKTFQDCVDAAGDKDSSDDLKKLAADSVERQQTYEQLSHQFIVHEYTTHLL